ncbi:MAG: DUF420 domain-containing protein [Phycisphaerae bacterium]|jgi:uncharacterized membrane protein YozB (DUF420 family)
MDLSLFPPVNAGLNATAAILLTAGFVAIRRRRIDLHKRLMISACIASAVFLACYVTYHTIKQRTTGQAHTRFPDVGPVRWVYYGVLFSHLVLAIAVVPLALVTLWRAFRGRFDRHARIARWTLPIWLYVSVTGVVVYWMLYHLAPTLAS